MQCAAVRCSIFVKLSAFLINILVEMFRCIISGLWLLDSIKNKWTILKKERKSIVLRANWYFWLDFLCNFCKINSFFFGCKKTYFLCGISFHNGEFSFNFVFFRFLLSLFHFLSVCSSVWTGFSEFIHVSYANVFLFFFKFVSFNQKNGQKS